MKIAVLLHGNMRTFLMPVREASGIRVCDALINNVINKKDVDVFISTDTSDFFYNGSQYWNDKKEIEVNNPNNFRFYPNIKIESHENCLSIIKEQLSFLPLNIKKINILNEKNEYLNNSRFNTVKKSNYKGSVPELLFSQYKKVYDCFKMMEQYENDNNFKYDVILKTRFDCIYKSKTDFDLETLDYKNNIYVPDFLPAVVFDWYALSKRENILEYLKLYENLGFTINKPVYGFDCWSCGRNIIYGDMPEDIKKSPSYPKVNFCSKCKKSIQINYFDLTIASEYHIHETLNNKRVNIKKSINSGFIGWVYRYLDENNTSLLEDILKFNSIKNIKVFGNLN